MNDIISSIREKAEQGYLSLSCFQELMKIYNLSFKELEKMALENDVIPLRYQRNFCTISRENQLKLFNSNIAIIGCGGLGGNISEYLTRIGVGNITIMDFDVFEEHNMNRQNFSNMETLGKYKAEVLKEGLEKINPAVTITALNEEFTKNSKSLKNATLVIDALDNPDVKKELHAFCVEHDKQFVHGAIAGYNGQFLCSDGLHRVYRSEGKGTETGLGNPSFSASFAASVQASLAIRLLLDNEDPLEDNILITDLFNMEFHILPK